MERTAAPSGKRQISLWSGTPSAATVSAAEPSSLGNWLAGTDPPGPRDGECLNRRGRQPLLEKTTLSWSGIPSVAPVSVSKPPSPVWPPYETGLESVCGADFWSNTYAASQSPGVPKTEGRLEVDSNSRPDLYTVRCWEPWFRTDCGQTASRPFR